MANKKPIPKAAKRGEELVQRTRAAVLNTFDAIEKRGKVLSEILADEFEENPIKFMELASKLMPKEVSGNVRHDHEHKHTHESISDTLEWIEGIAGTTTEGQVKKPRPN